MILNINGFHFCYVEYYSVTANEDGTHHVKLSLYDDHDEDFSTWEDYMKGLGIPKGLWEFRGEEDPMKAMNIPRCKLSDHRSTWFIHDIKIECLDIIVDCFKYPNDFDRNKQKYGI